MIDEKEREIIFLNLQVEVSGRRGAEQNLDNLIGYLESHLCGGVFCGRTEIRKRSAEHWVGKGCCLILPASYTYSQMDDMKKQQPALSTEWLVLQHQQLSSCNSNGWRRPTLQKDIKEEEDDVDPLIGNQQPVSNQRLTGAKWR